MRTKRKGRTPLFSDSQGFQGIFAPKIRGQSPTRLASNGHSQHKPQSLRDLSLSTQLGKLNLGDESFPAPIAEGADQVHVPNGGPAPKADGDPPKTPSHIPKLASRPAMPSQNSSPTRSSKKTPKPVAMFMSKESNTPVVWDHDSRLEEVENACSQFRDKLDGAVSESTGLRETITLYKIRST